MNARLMIDCGWVESIDALVGAAAAACERSAVTISSETSVPSAPDPATVPAPVAAVAVAAPAPPPASMANAQAEMASQARLEVLLIDPPRLWRPHVARSPRSQRPATVPLVGDVSGPD